MSDGLLGDLLVDLATVGASARTLPSFRTAALERLRLAVPFDGAIFHALSPRVPLETGAFIGIELDKLRETVPGWDAVAVTLGRLRELANVELVATDRAAFPIGSPQ